MNRRSSLAVVATLGLTLVGCDFEVTNPGPTDDRFLDNPEAHQAMANGAARQLFSALANVAYTTSAVSRELFPSGSTSSFGISARQQRGLLEWDDEHINGPWVDAQQSRYIGESGFTRMGETNPGGTSAYRPAVEAALWAGFANRLLGENWCEATIDAGPIVSREDMLRRAEEWFTTAITAAGSEPSLAEQRTAAIAGRAAVRMHLGDWAGAVSDAGDVPTDFEFSANYESAQQSEYNRTYFAGASEPYRAVTVWNTVYEDYGESGDPRTPWVETGQEGDAAVQMVNNSRVPFFRQEKFAERGADIRLASGLEMRLIEAEQLLRSGNVEGAFAIVNARRTELGLDALDPADATEGWTMFKRERGVEMWLEGRRLGDLYRWNEDGTPGSLHPMETAGDPASYLDSGQDLCYPISKSERESNPTIPNTPTG
ncbi:RagB/SusD family nutrient uptake outer membrane protein [Gaopeijia maritima]|uniref:RagB/SusD family nutrient uptake outer membrane protein n=1 Tax=Gaopeijia maritima TaxID=3119007 RepID=A0ABU9E948_9BACT